MDTLSDALNSERFVLHRLSDANRDAFCALFVEKDNIKPIRDMLGDKIAHMDDMELADKAFSSRLEFWEKNGFGPYLVMEKQTGDVVGCIGPYASASVKGAIDFILLIAPERRGQGIAAEAGRVLQRHIFEQLHWDSVDMHIKQDNQSSIRAAEKMGAVFNNVAHDTGLHVYRVLNPASTAIEQEPDAEFPVPGS